MKRKQTVLVTGATKGIGRATALQLAEYGHTVIATGRDTVMLAALEDEAKVRAIPLHVTAMDVTDRVAVAATVQRIIVELGPLDALVNNAGYGLAGPIEELENEQVTAVFETNVFAVLHLFQVVMPQMRAKRFGTIVNVGSIAGQVAVPGEGAYCASKFALHGLTRSMRMEAASFGVRVVLVEPGEIKTDFAKNTVWGTRRFAEESPYASVTHETAIRRKVREMVARGPDPVAMRIRQIVESRSPRPRYVVGLDARAGALLSRILPDSVMDFLIRRAVTGD